MDEDIRAAIADLKLDLKDGFKSVNARIDTLVTKDAFDATVQRLDAQHGTLRRDFDAHEQAAPAHRAAAAARAEAVRAEVKTELEGFRTTTRWAIGITVPATGLLVSLAQWLLAP